MSRPSWDEHFLKLAEVHAERSTCDRAWVGCVLVRDNHLLSAGYNGAPKGLEHCDDTGHDIVHGHCVRTVHAEVNAIIQAAKHGVTTEGATAYVTHSPCRHCAMALLNAGVTRVVFKVLIGMGEGLAKLREGTVEVDWRKGGQKWQSTR